MKYILKILKGLLVGLVVAYGLSVALLSIPMVQEQMTTIVQRQLTEKLGTPVEIGRITFGYPNRLILDNVQMSDQENSPLFKVTRLGARFEWMDLIRHGRISIHTAQVFGLHAHINRPTPTAPTNAQFLIDALASKDKTSATPIDLRVNSLLVRRGRISYNVDSEVETPGEFNPSHLALENINATLSLKALRSDSINGVVKRLDFTEKSGFKLKALEMKLLANKNMCRLLDFHLHLPHSQLLLDSIRVEIPSTYEEDSPTSDIHYTGHINENTHFTLADIGMFVPALQHFTTPLSLSAHVKGDSKGFSVPLLCVYSEGNHLDTKLSNVEMQFSSHLPVWLAATVDHLKADTIGIPLVWSNIKGEEVPIPPTLSHIGYVDFTGQVEGPIEDLQANGWLRTGVGELNAHASLEFAPNQLIRYKGRVYSEGVNFERLLGKEKKLGVAAFNLNIHNQPQHEGDKSMYLQGEVSSLEFSGYQYQHIYLDGTAKPMGFDGKLTMKDQHASVIMDGHIDLSKGSTAFDMSAQVRNLNPHALKLTTEREGCEYDANLQAHFSGNHLDNLEGHICVDSIAARLPHDQFFMEELVIKTDLLGNGLKRVSIDSEAIQAHMEGQFTYESLPASFVQITNKYLPTLLSSKANKGRKTENEFAFDLKLNHSNFYPYILNIPFQVTPSMNLYGEVSDTKNEINISGFFPHVIYNGQEYEAGIIRCYNSQEELITNASISKHMGRDNARITLMLDAIAKDNCLNTEISWGNDSPNTYAGSISSEISFSRKSASSDLRTDILIYPSEIIINDTVWNISSSSVRIDSSFVDIHQLGIKHDTQHLTINGRLTDKQTDSLVVELKEVAVGYILDIVRFKAVEFAGKATGKVFVNGVLGNMQARTDLEVKDFYFNKGILGDMKVSAKWDHEIGVVLAADIWENDTVARTQVGGFISPQQKGLDLNIEAQNTNLTFLNSFLGGIFSDIEGRASGQVHLYGPFKNLNLEGDAEASANFIPQILNAPISLRKDSIHLRTGFIEIPHATVYDRHGQNATISGRVTHEHLRDMAYDFNFSLNNFLFYQTTDFGNMPFYGSIYGSGYARLHGGGNELHVNGNLTTDQGTLFVYNMSTPETLTDGRFITFIDRTPRPPAPANPNLRLFNRTNEETQETSSPLQIFIDAAIDATPSATMKVIMDSRSGDYISAQGSGNIRLYFSNEETNLHGTYMIESGEYKMSIQDVILKDFQLQQGSEVSFNGSETNLNLQAVHTVNSASLTDLIPDASFNQNTVKVNCIINMTGRLENPLLEFDLDMPTINEEERQLVRSAISTDEQMRTQIIYLLGVGKFYTFDNANMEGQQSSNAMSSLLSSTLSGQLNNILSQALNVSNWNFSSNLSTGQEGWNDLEVEGILSGSLLNNRLLINGNFGYRENEMRNSNFVGDVDLQYLFTQEFRFKAYNKTNDRYFAKQTFNTQGIGFIYKREFDTWRDFFRLKKK